MATHVPHASHAWSVPTLCVQYGYTALILFAMSGHVAIVELLIKHGAALDLEDEVTRDEGAAGCVCARRNCEGKRGSGEDNVADYGLVLGMEIKWDLCVCLSRM